MCFSDLSSCNLIRLASSLAIAIVEDLTADEVSTLAAFFTALADNLTIMQLQNQEMNHKIQIYIETTYVQERTFLSF